MIYHFESRTAIFEPAKCGSSSLREMVRRSSQNFLVCTGPAPWDSKDMTFHIQSSVASSVHQYPIVRKVLLFREPESRILSLWKLRFHLDRIPFDRWLRSIQPTGHRLPMRAYCPEATQFVRMGSMAGDMSSLFGGSWERIHINQSAEKNPEVTDADRELMRSLYPQDFDLYQTLRRQKTGRC